MKFRFLLLLLIPGMLIADSIEIADSPPQMESIVPPWSEISDFQARYELAKLLTYKRATAGEALHHIALLLEEEPGNSAVEVIEARAYMQTGQFRKANDAAAKIRNEKPKDVHVLYELANLETDLGHYKIAQKLYEQAIAKSEAIDPEWTLTYAGARERWGEFPEAIETFRAYLQEHPGNIRVHRLLASALAGQQRYDEAEQILWKTYYGGDKVQSLLELARVKTARGDYQGSLYLLDHLDASAALAIQATTLRADLLAKECQKEAAIDLFQQLAEESHDRYDKAFYLQRAVAIAEKYEDFTQAAEVLKEVVELTPESVAARYWQHAGPWDLQEIVDQTDSAQELAEWALRFAEDGCLRAAVWLNDAAVKLDPEFYPARIALADLYSGLMCYGNAEQVYFTLLEAFPNNFTYTHHYTRLLSWDKRYVRAYCMYDELIESYPDNPILKFDRARLALWWQKGCLARSLYQDILECPVDTQVLQQISCNEHPLANYRDFLCTDTLYSGYETLLNAFGWPDCLECGEMDTEVVEAILDFWAAYRIQKTCSLEMEAELAGWNHWLISALCHWKALCDFVPGDYAYLFNYAQTWCGLGMCQRSTPILEHLLWRDPNHPMVNRALARRETLDRAQAVGQYTYWHEEGYGELTGITRQRYRLGVDQPCSCLSSFRLYLDRYMDRTVLYPANYDFNAITAEYRHTYSPYTSGFLSVSAKLGGNYQLRQKWLGEARLESRVRDCLGVSLGCLRADEFYNPFGIQRGVQSTTFWTRASWEVNRYFLVEPEYQYRLYTDHNSANIGLLNMAYQITNYPTTLRLLVQGEYRNAAFTNEFIYAGSTLVNIIHPYWAPQRYFAGRAGIEVLQNLDTISFCNAEQHYFKARFMVVEDTQDNFGGSASVEWRREWDNRWSLWVSAVIHRSKQWDAEGLWSGLNLRF